MLYTIAVLLVVLWLLGLLTSFTLGGLIHLLLVIAVISSPVERLIRGRRRLNSPEVTQPMNPFFIADTAKTFEQASADLEVAVAAEGFGVLAVHDLGETLRSEGIDFHESCRVFEVCNPQQAARVLMSDMTLNMALPCRISVYTEAGQTRIGMIRPEEMLQSLSSDPELMEVARQVDASATAIIRSAASLSTRSASMSVR